MFCTTTTEKLANIINHWHHEFYEKVLKYAALRVRRAAKPDLNKAKGTIDKHVVRLTHTQEADRIAREAEKSKLAAEAAKAKATSRPTPLSDVRGLGMAKINKLKAAGFK